jgi:hypothetical protein
VTFGGGLLSTDGARTPISGISKYYRTRLNNAIIANTGGRLSKEFTSHDLRRTVAMRLAEALGEQGEKLVKRVLGHSDGSVTAIYNRYAYVREMRTVLEKCANELTALVCASINESWRTMIAMRSRAGAYLQRDLSNWLCGQYQASQRVISAFRSATRCEGPEGAHKFRARRFLS